MFVEDYYRSDGERICFSRAGASGFAKRIADDFNPLHDEDAKMFCVPGDLLFASTLSRDGLAQQMCFEFAGMVPDQLWLHFEQRSPARRELVDDDGKLYMSVEQQGELSRDEILLEQLIRRYVAFSGHNFPHVLVPLMSEHGVMINPDRPLVIYNSMSLQLDRLDIEQPELELQEAKLQVNGKKARVCMHFSITSNGVAVGQGQKHMSVRGLRGHDPQVVQRVVDGYLARKAAAG